MSKSDLQLTPAEIAAELRAYDAVLGIPEDPNIIELGKFLHQVRKVEISYERVENRRPNKIYINKNLENIVKSFALRQISPNENPYCFGMKTIFEDLPEDIAFAVSYDDDEDPLFCTRKEEQRQ